MEDRSVLRLGAWAAIIGGILAIVVNVSVTLVRQAFAPPGGGDLDDPAAEVDLAVAAGTGTWELVGIGIVVALLILLAAFYAITKSIEDAPAKWWARLGLGAVLLATTIGWQVSRSTPGWHEEQRLSVLTPWAVSLLLLEGFASPG